MDIKKQFSRQTEAAEEKAFIYVLENSPTVGDAIANSGVSKSKFYNIANKYNIEPARKVGKGPKKEPLPELQNYPTRESFSKPFTTFQIAAVVAILLIGISPGVYKTWHMITEKNILPQKTSISTNPEFLQVYAQYPRRERAYASQVCFVRLSVDERDQVPLALMNYKNIVIADRKTNKKYRRAWAIDSNFFCPTYPDKTWRNYLKVSPKAVDHR
jgi:hypothetical protein